MKLKGLVCITAITLLSISLIAGCGSAENNSQNDLLSSESKIGNDDNGIKIENIDWSVKESIDNSKRYVMLNFTNNSNCTLAGVEMTFKEKSDVTEDKKKKYFDFLKKELSINNDDLSDLKEQSITMSAHTDKLCAPGETVNNANLYYYSGSYYMRNMEFYDLVEPDIATIKYVDEEKNQIKTKYYDFTSKNYSDESEVEVANQWEETAFSKKVPTPESKVIEFNSYNSGEFSAEVYGISQEGYKGYVQKCKDAGFTKDIDEYDDNFFGYDKEGYKLHVSYDVDDCKMHLMFNDKQ